MKGFIALFLFVCIAVSCKKRSSEVPQNTSVICFDTVSFRTNIQEPFQAIFFVDSKTGFIAGNRGGIYKTTDSAKTWTALNSTVSIPIHDLFFINAQTGFAVGGEKDCGGTGCIPPGGFILRTLDGGQTWTTVYTPNDKVEITSVYFINASTGFCVANNVIVKTTDGGQTWSEYKVNTFNSQLKQILFINAQVGFAVGLFGQVVKTDDGGTTWTVKGPYGNAGFYAIAANGTTYLAGQGKMIKSTDNGISWNELPTSPTNIFALHFIDDKRGFALGGGNYSGGDLGYSYGSIYCTDDGGLSWAGTADVKTGTFRNVSFPSDRIGYASVSDIFGDFRVMRLTVK